MRTCTCHPDDSPPSPCVRQYALNHCRMLAAAIENLRLYATDINVNHIDWDDAGLLIEFIDDTLANTEPHN